MSLRIRVFSHRAAHPPMLLGILVGSVLLSAPLSAEIKSIRGTSGNLCVNPVCLPTTVVPVVQGATTDYTLTGDWTNHVTQASISPSGGVTAAFDSANGGTLDTASIRIRLTVAATAAPGERVLSLKSSNGASADPFKAMTMRILVVRRGTVTGSPTTVMPDYFTTADVRLVGNNLTNAGVDADIPGLLSRSIVSNTDTEIVVRLTFGSRVGEAHGKIRFFDQACGSCKVSTRYWFRGADALGYTPIDVLGPNAVKEVTVRTGTVSGRFIAGQMSTVTVRLVRPADQPDLRSIASTTSARTSSVTTSGVTVYWKMDPLHAEPVSGTLVVPAGQDSASFSVRTKGYITSGSTGLAYPTSLRIETRIGNPNATTAPALKIVTFPAIRP